MAILNYNINTQDEYEPWIYYEEWKSLEIPQGVFPEIKQVPRWWPRHELGSFGNEFGNLFYVWDWRDYSPIPYLLHYHLRIGSVNDGIYTEEIIKFQRKLYGHLIIAERVHPQTQITQSIKEIDGHLFDARTMRYLDSCGIVRRIGEMENFNLFRWFDPNFLWVEENIDPNYPDANSNCIPNFRYRIFIPGVLEEYSDLEIIWWVDGGDSDPPPATLNCGDCEIDCDSVYNHLIDIKTTLRSIK